MYLAMFNRVIKNIIRVPGRSLLLGIIIFVVTVLVIQGIAIEAGAKDSIATARESLGSEVVLQTNFQGFQRRLFDSQEGTEPTRVDLTQTVADTLINSPYLLAYNYEVMASVSSDDIDPLESENTDSGAFPTQIRGREGMFRELAEFRLQGNSQIELQTDFYNGSRKLIQGRFFTQEEITEAKPLVIIDTLLAEKNNLQIDSTFTLKSPGSSKGYLVEVVGIYEDTVQSDTSAPVSMMLRANTIYAPYTLAQIIVTEISSESVTEGSGRPADVLNSATYYLKDPSYIELFKQEASDAGLDTEKYSLSANDAIFARMVGPLQSLSDFARITVIAVLIAGALILVLLMTLITRERKLEIGILRALGASKKSVALQFASEIIIISAIFVLLGTFLGSSLAQETGDYLLAREITTQTQALEERGLPMGMGMRFRSPMATANVETIEEVKVFVGFDQVKQIILYALLISLAGTLASTYWTMKFEPMNILSSRS